MPTSAARTIDDATKDLARFREVMLHNTGGPHAYVLLLGLDLLDVSKLVQSIDKGLPFRCYDRLARNVGLPADQLIELVDIPRRTLLRRKSEGRFSPNESDRLLRVARLFGKALELFDGDRDAAIDWLTARQLGLGGAIPFQLARSETGAREVESLLGRLEYGVFS
jgi:putative toxin-antitoxin system antitoxin component (TIGR02293 family)